MNYYETLEVPKNASQDEIKKKYRQLALLWHPDRNKSPEAEAKFKEISNAYSVLSDPEKRNNYDRFGTEKPQQGFNPFNDDVFSQFFGGFGFNRQQQQSAGRDVQIELNVTLEEVATGTSKSFSFNRRETCTKCNGKGGTGQTCSACNGYGQVRQQHGFFTMASTCGHCRGSGIKITKHCEECQGEGSINTERTLEVKIPAGIQDEAVLRIIGEGESNNGRRGNLYCLINVLQHNYFTRDGNNLVCSCNIDCFEACLGKEIEIPTIFGYNVKVKIPESCQNGQRVRIPNKGIKTNSYTGDQILIVNVDIPKNLSKKQKELIRKINL